MIRTAIVDYDLGNLLNVQRALTAVGVESVITHDPAAIDGAAAIVLPGVGAFGEGITNMERRGLIAPVVRAAERGKPVLGICLGMQLLMDESEEFGRWRGLGLIPGQVVRFDDPAGGRRFKIPQIGWNRIEPRPGERWTGTILDGLDQPHVYFVHSFYVRTRDPADCLAEAEYGHNRFCAVARRGNVFGCQFHPEKSGQAGLRILRNFAGLIR